jgi:hypothetical protein
MTPEAWAAVGTALASVLAGAGAYWGKSAADRSKPTSNGFAAGVRLDLATIRETQARQGEILAELLRRLDRNERRIDRLTDHLIDDGR